MISYHSSSNPNAVGLLQRTATSQPFDIRHLISYHGDLFLDIHLYCKPADGPGILAVKLFRGETREGQLVGQLMSCMSQPHRRELSPF